MVSWGCDCCVWYLCCILLLHLVYNLFVLLLLLEWMHCKRRVGCRVGDRGDGPLDVADVNGLFEWTSHIRPWKGRLPKVP